MSNITIKPHLILFQFLIVFVIIRANDIPNDTTKPSEVTKTFASFNILRQGDGENDDDIKQLLEEKYKFRNDETSTRYRITQLQGQGPAKEGGRLKNIGFFLSWLC